MSSRQSRIDTRTDTHLWAEQYDCDLNGIFAAQSAIALKVAEQLQAKLSTAEKLDMARPPTADLTAFEFYTRAKNLVLGVTSVNETTKANVLEAADLLNQVSRTILHSVKPTACPRILTSFFTSMDTIALLHAWP